jgi:hypothetical protein
MQISQITNQDMLNIVSELSIAKTIDLGCSFVHHGTHPVHGEITVIATNQEHHALIC